MSAVDVGGMTEWLRFIDGGDSVVQLSVPGYSLGIGE